MKRRRALSAPLVVVAVGALASCSSKSTPIGKPAVTTTTTTIALPHPLGVAPITGTACCPFGVARITTTTTAP